EHVQDPTAKQVKSAPHQNQVRVIGDVGARRSKMNEWLCLRRDIPEGVDVRHYIVPEPFFIRGNRVEIDFVEIRTHLSDCIFSNRDTQFTLRLFDRDRESAPRSRT